jgi:hypothetical protein
MAILKKKKSRQIISLKISVPSQIYLSNSQDVQVLAFEVFQKDEEFYLEGMAAWGQSNHHEWYFAMAAKYVLPDSL